MTSFAVAAFLLFLTQVLTPGDAIKCYVCTYNSYLSDGLDCKGPVVNERHLVNCLPSADKCAMAFHTLNFAGNSYKTVSRTCLTSEKTPRCVKSGQTDACSCNTDRCNSLPSAPPSGILPPPIITSSTLPSSSIAPSTTTSSTSPSSSNAPSTTTSSGTSSGSIAPSTSSVSENNPSTVPPPTTTSSVGNISPSFLPLCLSLFLCLFL